MRENTASLLRRLAEEHRLSLPEYRLLLEDRSPETAAQLANLAVQARMAIYGKQVFIRGLIEVSNFCRQDCLYCGIRRSNRACERYRLSAEDILACCHEGYALGFRTFVLQGGEDGFFTDAFLAALLQTIKQTYPDCAVTLSLGQRSRESYQRLRDAGADRYLLRHETADPTHYQTLHPPGMTLQSRMDCLYQLKDLGYQVGCGFMVGSPHQTLDTLAQDLWFIQQFQPDMCGIGPFIPQTDTPFGREKAGTLALTCYLLSIIRLIRPNILLPATTALGSIQSDGREQGILAGANVVMPNLSPPSVRKKYALYDNKLSDGSESAQCKAELTARMAAIGYEVVTARGDIRLTPPTKP